MPSSNLESPTKDRDRESYLDELPDEVEMSLFDHLEELRWRLFYGIIAELVDNYFTADPG